MESKRKMEVKLFADPNCWKFREEHPEEFDSFGCGPGGIGDWLVPDTIWGLSIKIACQIHDWYYRLSPGDTEEDRAAADRILYNNILRIVNAKGGNLVSLRRLRAKTYYEMVRWFGAPAYWEDRNKPEEFKYVNLNL